MRSSLRVLLLSLACSAALSAQAQNSKPAQVNIPAGDLVAALDTLARQSGTQFVYRADQLKGLRTQGVQGNLPADQALDRVLSGSGHVARRDAASGAVVIVRQDAPPRPAPAARPTPAPTGQSAEAAEEPVTQLENVQVTGSRIPRAQIEGPAPITVVTAEQIQSAGFTSVPDVLRSLSQNSGSVQGQQNTTSAQSTPGAQAVDLRGLGPNHTLVLINGRRIADFPLPLNGRSNFTDIGNIPLGMIDRIEVLTGSASAVYGSDAMAGVINFILKKSTDGTTIDYRYGDTSRGGGESHKLTLTTGFERGEFSGIVGVEFLNKRPLWGYERSVQDSTLDAPTSRRRLPRLTAQLYNWDDDVNIAPADGCAAMAGLNQGTTVLAEDRFGEPYCGSERAIAYRTIQNERKGYNAYGSFEYRFSDTLSWFADVQLGRQEVKLLTGTNGNDVVSDVMGWEFHDPASTDNNDKVFYNAVTGRREVWSRQFSPEEIGGLRNRMNTTTQKTLAVTTGLQGAFGEAWNWEAAYNHSQYKADVGMPRIWAEAANRLFLGERQGYDADGYAIYSPDPARLFTPLTQAEFASIAAMSTFRPKAENDNLSFTLDTPSLFTLPAGDVGFAAAIEYGRQSYEINPDPYALTADAYYGPRYGDGEGDRDRWSVAGEFRLPLLSSLQASLAGRYDRYEYGNKNPGKFTYSAGLEWRPFDTLLVRGSYGTGFRAPDMHYLFAGDDYYRTLSTDYFQCRTDEPGFSDGDCYDDGTWDINTFDVYTGNMDLDVETSKSFTAGFVWSPVSYFDLAVDYYKIEVSNQVQTQSRELLRSTEADCRLGVTDSGASVDINSPTCVDALSRVIRDQDGFITSVHFSPINIAKEETSGVDVTANYRLLTASAGDFVFRANYNWTHRHTRQLYPGDPTEDMLDVSFADTTLPRNKGNVGVSWDKGAFGASLFGNYVGRVANYNNDAWTESTWRFNAGARYDVTDHLRISLSINNLFDKMPPRDATWANYPYYDTSWFDSFGRSYYLQFTWKLGGSAL
ncbi:MULTISPECIES: TonB-dependent receptor [unclassified Pseudoxanthomonas]|uniref:TonB-dependent receptor n=1 Tax=unclassified Pseudoxanthomonas TaxID=2645906 RepID=UPI0016185260|nr:MULTISPECIES: TonB-dependent receptor [unclassified Pseudoxanthomonas]MBB3276044.1 outer membrane receptor protein involved in Fe transport [Pseudoxanthomonas sp. OG2]MBV7472875.1 TonB-dependent receptor [Pseudoxanthomonas sp. PXM05]